MYTSRDGAQYSREPIYDESFIRDTNEASKWIKLSLPSNTIAKFVKVSSYYITIVCFELLLHLVKVTYLAVDFTFRLFWSLVHVGCS